MQRCVKDRNSEKLNSLAYKINNMGQSRPNVKHSRYTYYRDGAGSENMGGQVIVQRHPCIIYTLALVVKY